MSSGVALAQEAGGFNPDNLQLRVRGIMVAPDDDAPVRINGAAAGEADVSDSVVPEFDISYFFTKNIAAELILATAQHAAHYNGDTDLGHTMILPPTLTLQYHFTPESAFSPYVGAGVNYSYFYNEQSGTGFTDLDIDGGFGYALQAGVDYWLNDNWGLNIDVKKVMLDIDVSLNNGAIRSDVDLDPWIIGTGVSYRF